MKTRNQKRWFDRLVRVLEINHPSVLKELNEIFVSQLAQNLTTLRELRAKAMVTVGSVTYAGTLQVRASGSARIGKGKTMDIYEAARAMATMTVLSYLGSRHLLVSTSAKRSIKK